MAKTYGKIKIEVISMLYSSYNYEIANFRATKFEAKDTPERRGRYTRIIEDRMSIHLDLTKGNETVSFDCIYDNDKDFAYDMRLIGEMIEQKNDKEA